jgi:hypothetical protein
VSAGGTYTVTAAGICGSQTSNLITITVNQPLNYYIDADGDGYGTGASVALCTPQSGYATISGDCNDANPSVNPGATEICNAIDDNCDGIQLTSSIAPTSVSASSTSVNSGAAVTLTVIGGSLGSNAQWRWYSASCGGTSVGSGASITVNPTASTSYFVRAEGTCGNTACTSIAINVSSGCAPTGIVSTNTSYSVCSGSSITLTVQGTLGSGATWRWYKNGCGTGTSVGSGTSITVSPTTATTYYVRSEGGTCGTTACVSRQVLINSLPSTPLSISGRTTGLCSAQQVVYSIVPVTRATAYQWTVTTGATIVSGQGTTSITVNFTASLGNNTSCGSSSICVRSQNSCGYSAFKCSSLSLAPAVPGSITGPSSLNAQQVGTYSITAISFASTYTWTVPTGWTILSGQGTTTITVRAGSTSGNIGVSASNSCGSSTQSRKSVSINCLRACEFELELWPNPAKDVITFNSSGNGKTRLEIFDMTGHLVHQTTNETQINISQLSNGIYIVRVFDAENYYTTRLVIEH